MYKKEKMVKVIITGIEGLRTLNYAVDCHEKGCEKCPAHMSKAIRINKETTRCMFILPGLLRKEIDNCMEQKPFS
jgi:hypothetical protein